MNKFTHLAKYFIVFIFAVFLSLSSFSNVFAASLSQLENQINILTGEIEDLKMGSGGGHKSVSVHGYGELHYNNNIGGTKQMDFHRFVIGVHAVLTENIHLNAEVDFEHAAQEMEFEFGYLDFLIDPKINVRAGEVLVPVGFLNEYHEPPLFWSVERPELQSKIIPSTWFAGGAGINGELTEGLRYKLYVVNALQSTGFKSGTPGADCGDSALSLGGNCGFFRPKDGIRKGRRHLDHAISGDFAITGRVEYSDFDVLPGTQVGFSFYTGDTTHGLISEGGRTTVVEGDVKFRWTWFDMNATIVNIFISDAAAITMFNRTTGGSLKATETIPDNIFGFNVQAGVHVPQLLNMNTDHDFIPFILYENFDLQDSVPTGFARDRSLDTEVITGGFSYMPASNVALKMDWQHFMFGNNTSKDKFNMGMAFMY